MTTGWIHDHRIEALIDAATDFHFARRPSRGRTDRAGRAPAPGSRRGLHPRALGRRRGSRKREPAAARQAASAAATTLRVPRTFVRWNSCARSPWEGDQRSQVIDHLCTLEGGDQRLGVLQLAMHPADVEVSRRALPPPMDCPDVTAPEPVPQACVREPHRCGPLAPVITRTVSARPASEDVMRRARISGRWEVRQAAAPSWGALAVRAVVRRA